MAIRRSIARADSGMAAQSIRRPPRARKVHRDEHRARPRVGTMELDPKDRTGATPLRFCPDGRGLGLSPTPLARMRCCHVDRTSRLGEERAWSPHRLSGVELRCGERDGSSIRIASRRQSRGCHRIWQGTGWSCCDPRCGQSPSGRDSGRVASVSSCGGPCVLSSEISSADRASDSDSWPVRSNGDSASSSVSDRWRPVTTAGDQWTLMRYSGPCGADHRCR